MLAFGLEVGDTLQALRRKLSDLIALGLNVGNALQAFRRELSDVLALGLEVRNPLPVLREQHDPSIRQLRSPFLEIPPGCLVGMEAIHVQEIDRAVVEVRQRVVKGSAHEFREIPVSRANEGSEILEAALVIEARMTITAPGI